MATTFLVPCIVYISWDGVKSAKQRTKATTSYDNYNSNSNSNSKNKYKDKDNKNNNDAQQRLLLAIEINTPLLLYCKNAS